MTDFVSVEIGGLVLLEPSNFITNLISGAACWIFIKQLRKKHLKSKISLLYQIFFLGIGFSSVAAGFTHLFAYYLDGISLRVASWVFTGLGVLTMQLATAYNYFKPKLVKNVTPFFIAQFVIYCLSLAYFMNFKVVIINTSVGLLGFVVTMELFSYL